VEITLDHMSNGRIRHNRQGAGWRDDKAPAACTLDQLD
jgi:ATP-dependent DNA ligase